MQNRSYSPAYPVKNPSVYPLLLNNKYPVRKSPMRKVPGDSGLGVISVAAVLYGEICSDPFTAMC